MNEASCSRMTSIPANDECAKYVSDMFSGDHSNSNDDKTFFFETDYLALKGNVDYLKLMRTLAVLDVQRMKVCQDIDKLERLKMKVREDPVAVKEEILSGELPFVSRCNIEKVPEIDWSKYKMIDFDGKFSSLTTRRMARQDIKPRLNIKEEPEEDKSGGEGNAIRVRGRIYTHNKPQTFNQLWTVEEQLRLEQLLVEFPPEPVESRRWKKIAEALGNRTKKQVCSRVQKYFQKLQKAGIAIPGRPTKGTKSSKPAHIHKRHKHLLYKPTTFFPGVAMKELGDSDSEEGSTISGPSTETCDLSHWVDILTQIKEEKESFDEDETKIFHTGYRCSSCGEEPIVGIRWECGRCQGVSMCSDCMAGLLDADVPCHPINHVFQPYRISLNIHYRAQNLGSSNYLDPNYLL